MDIEKLTLPGSPLWRRLTFYNVLMAGGWLLIGFISTYDFPLLTAVVGGPGAMVLILAPLAMTLILQEESPGLVAMCATAVVLLFTAFTVPGDLYLRTFGTTEEAVVTEVVCVRSKGTCSYEYDLRAVDGSSIPWRLYSGSHDEGDQMKVVIDPAGVVPVRRDDDVSFGFFDLMALLAWPYWIAMIVQTARMRSGESGPPAGAEPADDR